MVELGSPRHGLVLLAGDWVDATVDLDVNPPDGWVPNYALSDSERRTFQVGWYRDWPVLRTGGAERLAYLVDLDRFGRLLRAKSADVGDSLEINVKEVTEEAARTIRATRGPLGDAAAEAEATQALRRQVQLTVTEAASFATLDVANAALRVRLA